MTDPAALFRIATKEFCILQLEKKIVAFLGYVAAHQPVVIGEIGIKHGGNSFLFVRGLPRVTKYMGMDLRLENTGTLKFFRRDKQRLHLLEGDSQLPSAVKRTRKILANEQFDFLFIDGDHEYDGVLQDLIQWYPLVRPGGLTAFHDIMPDEESRTGKRPQRTSSSGAET
ncbi:MAG: cephalosporin hydroxylase [Gammaproteobacteria bacterium]